MIDLRKEFPSLEDFEIIDTLQDFFVLTRKSGKKTPLEKGNEKSREHQLGTKIWDEVRNIGDSKVYHTYGINLASIQIRLKRLAEQTGEKRVYQREKVQGITTEFKRIK